jgi:hypothetical protein
LCIIYDGLAVLHQLKQTDSSLLKACIGMIASEYLFPFYGKPVPVQKDFAKICNINNDEAEHSVSTARGSVPFDRSESPSTHRHGRSYVNNGARSALTQVRKFLNAYILLVPAFCTEWVNTHHLLN